VNKDHHARLGFLINEEHALAKPVRCGPEAGLGVLMLWSVFCELLIGAGKLAGGKCFTSAGYHYDTRNSSRVRRNQSDSPPNGAKGVLLTSVNTPLY